MRTPIWLPVAAIAAVAAGLATLSDGAPTGLSVWDAILKAALAAVVVYFAAQAPRWAIIVLLTGSILLAGATIWFVVGLVGLLTTVASAWLDQRVHAVGALSGAIAIQVLLRLPSYGPFGLQSAVAAASVLFIMWSGYKYASARARKITRRTAAIGGLLLAVILAVGAVGVLSAKADLERGIAAARRSVDAARDADTEVVESELEFARQALLDGDAQLQSPTTRLLRLVPVAAQHYDAVATAASEGANVLGVASQAVDEADISTIRLSAGSVDLGALQDMAPTLQEMAIAVSEAQTEIEASRSGWTLPFVRDRIDELLVEVDELAPEVELAADAATVLPAMLGSDAPRRYFVIFGTPAESREFGGLLGSWALIEFDKGSVDLLDSGRIFELYELAYSNEWTEESYPDWYVQLGNATAFPQNLTSSPDFSVVAQAGSEVFDGLGGQPLDGFIYLDAWAIIDLLQLTGPVQVPFQDDPLTYENAAQFLFVDQYKIEGRRTDTFNELAAVLSSSIERLASLELPGPERLGEVLGPSARAGRLQMITFDEAENDFLRSVHLLRDFEFASNRDFMALVQATGTAAKLDLYLQRQVSYSAQVSDAGTVRGSVDVVLTADVPADAPDRNVGGSGGVNIVLLSLYVPHVVTNVTIDGVPVDYDSTVEGGYPRYILEVEVQPDNTPIEVSYEFEGAIDPDLPYGVEVWHQPLVNNDQVTVSYDGPQGQFSHQVELVENVIAQANGIFAR